MAMMLIDKTKDSACKSAEADAIRVKTGGSAQIAYDWANNKGYADAIAAISGSGLKYKIGDFTLTSSVAYNTLTGITHNLGVVPKCVIVWQDTYDDDNVPTEQVNAGYVYLDRIIDMKQRLTSSISYSTSIYCSFAIAANSTVGVNVGGPTSDSYMPKAATKPTAEKLFLYSTGPNNRWRSGVDYHYFVAEGWWETT